MLTEDVADLALGLTLAVLRRLVVNDRFVRQGLWLKETPPLARKVTGKRIGIFGLGQIGRSIARRAEGFNMIIQYTDVRPIEGVSYQYAASLTELAQMSDILVIAASAGPSTKGIVDRAVLDALGSSGVLINVARGSVVNEAELVAALKEKRIAGAGLDVFAEEPRVPEVLFDLDTVVLEPHQASATVETRMAMGQLVVDNVAAHFAGQALLTAVI